MANINVVMDKAELEKPEDERIIDYLIVTFDRAWLQRSFSNGHTEILEGDMKITFRTDDIVAVCEGQTETRFTLSNGHMITVHSNEPGAKEVVEFFKNN